MIKRKLLVLSTAAIVAAGGLFPKNLFAQEMSMQILSAAFTQDTTIPVKYTCQGKDVNPSLSVLDTPEGTKSLALIVDDPDAPNGMWVHWVVYNISPTKTMINEKTIPGQQGLNDFGKYNYGGPCPPSGTHRYFFKVYALDKMITPKKDMTKKELEEAMKGHVLAKAELMGLYKKK